jgi:acetylornithine deacetylase/succinyl-diaminopimelate desuccinylase-like protein
LSGGIGEPTSMQPVIAHKGKRAYKCCVRGKEAHSALTPQGVNAIEYAARIITYIRDMAERLQACEPRDYGFDVPFTTLQTGLISGTSCRASAFFSSSSATCPAPTRTHWSARSGTTPNA